MAEERMNDARKIPNEPMGYLRKLVVRAIAEKAYSPDGKDASCLTLGKRAGGTSHLLGRWRLDDGMDGDMGLLLDLRDLIAWQVSRRAVYLVSESLRDLPVEQAALASALAYRFGKQSKTDGPNPLGLAERLARAAQDRPADSAEPEWPDPNRWLHDMLLTAEFFARDGRVGTAKGD